jgi:hypothetical protein
MASYPSLKLSLEQEALVEQVLALRDESVTLHRAGQQAWDALQATPSYVEQQARAFVQACDALGIVTQTEQAPDPTPAAKRC